ncbi:MAG: glycosyl hydrolase family 18 protein [Reichenbachiella sp.]|uniref:Ig-like domain-containing protein n=1 Tax=Reichenbachiella sp. TaxID=2184521 RepID=UPI0032996B75
MKHSYQKMSWKWCVHRRLHQLFLYFLLQFFFISVINAQVNTGGIATTADHSKEIIGYITQWDAWKAQNAGLPAQGALTHLNIDYSKYTILNYSFFGVAEDGSLHSGDHRNKNIYQEGQTQAPSDILFTDIYSSWDFHILFGEIEAVQYINEETKQRAESYGYVVEVGGNSWSHPGWGLDGNLPLPLPKEGGVAGLLDMAHANGVKVMASIGGWSMCKHFPEMAADPVKRATFIADCEKLINMGFDGIDLDWEYPGPFAGMNFTGSNADYANYTTLVQEIRDAIGADKLITAAFSASVQKLQGFDWPALSQTMDFFNMMSYDYNGGWSNKAGHNSPLYAYDGAEAPESNWHDTFTGLIGLGVPANKINMGSAFYGRGVVTDGSASLNTTTLKRNETVQPDGPIVTCADFTNWPKDVYDGTPNFYYIKQQALGSGSDWTEHWDDQAKVPYLTKGNYFLSYDNEQSIALKAQYVIDNNLAGTIVWTVYGDLEISGSMQAFGSKLKRWSNVNSVLINTVNEVFAEGSDPSNQSPNVSLTAPQDGTTYQVGEPIIMDVTASDTDGIVSKVEFFEGGNKLGEDITSPYSYTWTNPAIGNYNLSAKAIDDQGATASSIAVAVTVSDSTVNANPQVTISNPTSGAELTTGNTITLSATASDSDGTIASVVFDVNGQNYNAVLNGGEYTVDWTPTSDGNYTIVATAIDYDALTASDQITVSSTTPSSCTVPAWDAASVYNGEDQVSHLGTLYEAKWWTQNDDPSTHSRQYDVWINLGPCGDPGNIAPSVSITSPSDNDSFEEGSITIDASASDSDGSVILVEFFVDGSKVGEDSSFPYSYAQAYTAGSYVLTTVATDDEGATTTSSAVNITVTEAGANVPPTVSITSPSEGVSFVEGTTVTIAADANDSDGSVTKVEFFTGTTKLGEDLSSPYSLNWVSTEGNHALTAIATDDESATSTSSVINITVTAEGGSCNVPQYQENGGYSAGSEVQNAGKKYQCKDYPYSGWCDGSAWAYEPGVGAHWQDAWNDLGDCGTNPPGNQLPEVSITSPSSGTNFNSGSTVSIDASASDADGTVTKVEFYVNAVKVGEDLSAPYNFSWTSIDGSHQLMAKATDDLNESTESTVVTITVGTVTPPAGDLPDRILVGYWHNFINGAGGMKLSEVSDKWDVINVSFAEPSTQLGSTMVFTPDNAIYPTVQEFKNDVAALQSQGKKVLISLGGANGAIHLDDASDAQNYSSSMIDIITEYGFDGLDIDLEGSSLSLDAGDSDFRNPTSPKIVNFINGTQTILSHFGSGLILTAAPETLYVQGGLNNYGGGAGAYLPVIYAFKDRLNYIHVQHYNTGCMLGLGQNSPCYQQGTADFQVAMAEMLLQGFPVPGHATDFPALRQDQVAIGLPASTQAAGGGYTTPATVHQALDYLVKGISYGGNYTMVNPDGYPNFRGLMTWSINWDEYNNFEFSNNHRPYLDALGATSARSSNQSDDSSEDLIEEEMDALVFYPNPFSNVVNLSFTLREEEKVTLAVYNQVGAKVMDLVKGELFSLGSHDVTWDSNQMPKGLYLFRLGIGDEVTTYRVVKH